MPKDKADQIAEKDKTKILKKYKDMTGIELAQKENISQECFTKPLKIAIEIASDTDDEHGFEEIEYEPPPFDPNVNYYDLYWKSFA